VVELTLSLRHAGAMTALDFPPAFLAVGALTAASGLIFARLAPDAGAELAGRHVVDQRAADQRPQRPA
jgi:hypothetical protein